MLGFPSRILPTLGSYALMPERATKIGSVSFFGLFQTELQHLPEIQQDIKTARLNNAGSPKTPGPPCRPDG